MLRALTFVFTMLVAAAVLAAESPVLQQMRQVDAALARITQEQQSVYQQFQMVQELRRNDERHMLPIPSSAMPPTSPPNYDDVRREQEARAQRFAQHQSELDRLYARYRELEEQKRPLLEALSALAQQRAEEQAAERASAAQPKPAPSGR